MIRRKTSKSIATRLNIGIDSLVFVDDNPMERARIRQSLPMDRSARAAGRRGAIMCAASPMRAISKRSLYVRGSAARRSNMPLMLNARRCSDRPQSMDDFLRGLRNVGCLRAIHRRRSARIVQLINKTNQFNTTTRRYTAEEIAEFDRSTQTLMTLQFRLLDRIGDNGLVSTMIMRPTSDREDVLEIENWVMSCRVFGRQLEFEAMNIAVEAARQRGVRAIIADYIATS